MTDLAGDQEGEGKVEYRRLGNSGLKVSTLSFGSWVTFGYQVEVGDAAACLKAAYDAGVNFFDNAEAYAKGRSEIIMGQALKDLGWRRDSYIVSSKVCFGSVENPAPTQRGLSRKHVTEACHQALERLQLDYLDLYFCHRPDPDTPIEETVRAMHSLIEQGKVLYWGTSEWSAADIGEAYRIARAHHLTPPTMEQPQYNMFERTKVEKEYRPLYDEMGLGTTIWSPLYGGLLTGKYNDGIPAGSRLTVENYAWLKDRMLGAEGQKKIEKVRALSRLATAIGTTTTQLALAWCLKNPHVSTVILGASRVEQLQENLKSLSIVEKLTPDVMTELEKILNNRP
ncbi:MAG: aldo/keto reductase [Rhodospirillales bacterium]|nr:aldo/keto reductase [Rhodospirillales bacterium]